MARYNENIEWSNRYEDIRVVLNKGEPDGLESSVVLPNIGREAHSYLWYIVKNYSRIGENDYYVFSQANPFDHVDRHQYCQVIDALMANTHKLDFFSFGAPIIDENVYPNKYYWKHHIETITASVFKNTYSQDYTAPNWHTNAIFVVSSKLLLGHSLRFYKKLLSILETEDSSDSYYAHAFERLWAYIFHTYEIDNEDKLDIDIQMHARADN